MKVVFLDVAIQSLFDDEDVWSAKLEYLLKKAMTFYSTIGSRSKFYMSFRRLLSLAYLCNRYSEIRRNSQGKLE